MTRNRTKLKMKWAKPILIVLTRGDHLQEKVLSICKGLNEVFGGAFMSDLSCVGNVPLCNGECSTIALS